MARKHVPRRGSLQYWPRKRSKRAVARVRSWAKLPDARLLGFAGYKVGMCSVMLTDNRPHSMTRGEQICWPATLVECPPIKVASVRFYKKTSHGFTLSSEILAQDLDKELSRKVTLPEKGPGKLDDRKAEDFEDIRLLVYTQPKLTGVGRKKPDLFEVALGGAIADKLSYAKGVLGKSINVADVFSAGQFADFHALTKGKGFQGPVKRFGIGLKSHKTEKGRRGPGSLGPWCGQTHIMWRVAHAGQMGFHQRTEYNKLILKIAKTEADINPKGGFLKYGLVKNSYVLVKGSLSGPKKRLLRFNHAIRSKKAAVEAPSIEKLLIN